MQHLQLMHPGVPLQEYVSVMVGGMVVFEVVVDDTVVVESVVVVGNVLAIVVESVVVVGSVLAIAEATI